MNSERCLKAISQTDFQKILKKHRLYISGSGGQRADLRNTDLSGLKQLQPGHLAGSNLAGAKLPDTLKFDGLEIVEQASMNARRLFFLILLLCAYSWLTIATTKDAHLITNTIYAPLPIIGTEILIVNFYYAGPLLVVGVFLYFHLIMQRLWEELARLPAVFPDGRTLDEKGYPWVFMGLVRAHVPWLQGHRPFLSEFQVFATTFLGWWALPLTLAGFWLRYLPRQDFVGTILHVLTLLLAVGFGTESYRVARVTLKGLKMERLSFKEAMYDLAFRHDRLFIGPGIIICDLLALLVLSFGPMSGLSIPAFTFYRPTADVSQDVTSFKHADLSRVSLRELHAEGTSFAGANLQGAQLQNADLRQTDLENANLRWAELKGANLNGANLRGVNLEGADLRDARLGFRSDEQWREISNVRLANVFNVRNSPAHFLEWAVEHGAVCIEDENKWRKVRAGHQTWSRPALDVSVESYCKSKAAND